MARRFLQANQEAASALRGRRGSMGTSITVAHCWVTTKALTEKKTSIVKVSPIYENITSRLYTPKNLRMDPKCQ